MTTTTTLIPQIFTKITDYKTPKRITFYPTKSPKPTKNSFTRSYVCCYNHQQGFNFGLNSTSKLLLREDKYLFDDKITKNKKNNKRVALVRFNNLGFRGGSAGGGGGGGGGGDGRVWGNIALAIGLTYLSFTGQLGWILDAIVSVWLFVVLVPIVGFGVLVWWAGRDMVQSECPNCGNEFQLPRAILNDEPQQCPYCSQPFSVVNDEFVRDPVKFSNQSTTFGEAFNDLSSRSKKGKASSRAIIDIEAEVTDVD